MAQIGRQELPVFQRIQEKCLVANTRQLFLAFFYGHSKSNWLLWDSILSEYPSEGWPKHPQYTEGDLSQLWLQFSDTRSQDVSKALLYSWFWAKRIFPCTLIKDCNLGSPTCPSCEGILEKFICISRCWVLLLEFLFRQS